MGIAESAPLEGVAASSVLENSVGVVHRRTVSFDLGDGGFRTDGGRILSHLEVAYETYGTLAPDGGNAILMAPPLTGDCHVAGFYGDPPDLRTRGWWDDMVGPGKPIDTTRWFVVCASVLGGCGGTTGPVSIDPETGRSFGSRFPDLTIGDMVESQRILLEHLGIGRLYAVVGGSMGGMQALEWSLRHPELVERCVCVAAAASLSAQALAFDIIGRNAILNDENWGNGQYSSGGGPAAGLSLARKIAHVTYLSAEKMDSKFGRRQREDDEPERFHTAFEIEKYLEHQGEKFVARFDANAYLLITQAMDGFDLGFEWGRTALPSSDADEAERGRIANARLVEAFERSRCRYLVVALSSDWLLPAAASREVADALLQAGRTPSFCVLESPHGHDGFLLEDEKLAQVVRAFLSGSASKRDAKDSGIPGLGAPALPFRRRSSRDRFDGGLRLPRAGRRLRRWISSRTPRAHARLHGYRRRHRSRCGDRFARPGPVGDPRRRRRGPFGVPRPVFRPRRAQPDPGRRCRSLRWRCARSSGWGARRWSRFRTSPTGDAGSRVLFGGRMPMTRDLPFEWYETPNLHPFTLSDFEAYCRTHGIEILETREQCDSWIGKTLLRMGLRNLAADRAIVRVTRQP